MILVMVGGGIGAAVREALMLVVPQLPGGSEAPIFVANMTASLLIGLAAGLAVKGGVLGAAGKIFITTGIMGGLSTFSSFVWGADKMLVDPSMRLRGLLFVGSIHDSRLPADPAGTLGRGTFGQERPAG